MRRLTGRIGHGRRVLLNPGAGNRSACLRAHRECRLFRAEPERTRDPGADADGDGRRSGGRRAPSAELAA